jgi:hypothetical protein
LCRNAPIRDRAPGAIADSSIPQHLLKSSPWVQKLIHSEAAPTQSHFTRVIIWNIRPHLLKQIGRPPKQPNAPDSHLTTLAEEFCQIYHYYLNGPYGFSQRTREISFSPTKMTLTRAWLSSLSNDLATSTRDLAEIDSDAASQFHRKSVGVPFRFSFRQGLSEGKSALVLGEIRFFPRVNDEETAPNKLTTAEKEAKLALAAKKSAEGAASKRENARNNEESDGELEDDAGTVPMSDFAASSDGDETKTMNDSRFFCYWMGRYIPGSVVHCPEFLLLNNRLVNLGLNKRWRCHLFVDHQTPVNQQKIELNTTIGKGEISDIQVYPTDEYDEEVHLLQQAVGAVNSTENSPAAQASRLTRSALAYVANTNRDAKIQFREWIDYHHKHYDQLIRFIHPINARRNQEATEFKSCQYSQKGEPINQLDVVHLKIKDYYGRIVHFEAKSRIVDTNELDFTRGNIKIRRLPEKIFGAENFELKAIHFLDKDRQYKKKSTTENLISAQNWTNQVVQYKEDFGYEQYEGRALRDWPEKLEIRASDFKGDIFDSPAFDIDTKDGAMFPQLKIRVLGHEFGGTRKDLKAVKRGTRTREKLKIRRQLLILDEKSNIYEVNQEDKYEFPVSTYSKNDNFTYHNALGIKYPGRYKLTFELLSESGKEDFDVSVDIPFSVRVGAIKKLKVDAGQDKTVRLGGQRFISLKAFDEFDNEVGPPAGGEEIIFPLIKFSSANNEIALEGELTITQMRRNVFALNLHHIRPGPNLKIPSRGSQKPQKVIIKPRVMTQKADSEELQDLGIEFPPFDISLAPAFPAKLVSDSFPLSFPATLVNHSEIPEFTVQFQDQFGLKSFVAHESHSLYLSSQPDCGLNSELTAERSAGLAFSFRFRSKRLELPAKLLVNPGKSAKIKLQLAYLDESERLTAPIEPLQLECTVIPDPSPVRAVLSSLPPSDARYNPKHVQFSVHVASEERFFLTFYNESGNQVSYAGLTGIELRAFGTKIPIDFDPGSESKSAGGEKFIPFKLSVPATLTGSQDCSILFKFSNHPHFPPVEFTLLPQFGSPHAWLVQTNFTIQVARKAATSVRIFLVDSNGNKLNPTHYPKIQPILTVEDCKINAVQFVEGDHASINPQEYFWAFPELQLIGLVGQYTFIVENKFSSDHRIPGYKFPFNLVAGEFHHLEVDLNRSSIRSGQYKQLQPRCALLSRDLINWQIRAVDKASNTVSALNEAIEVFADDLRSILFKNEENRLYLRRLEAKLVNGIAALNSVKIMSHRAAGEIYTQSIIIRRLADAHLQHSQQQSATVNCTIEPCARVLDLTLDMISKSEAQGNKVGMLIPNIHVALHFEAMDTDISVIQPRSLQVEVVDSDNIEYFHAGEGAIIKSEEGQRVFSFFPSFDRVERVWKHAGAHFIRVKYTEERQELLNSLLPAEISVEKVNQVNIEGVMNNTNFERLHSAQLMLSEADRGLVIQQLQGSFEDKMRRFNNRVLTVQSSIRKATKRLTNPAELADEKQVRWELDRVNEKLTQLQQDMKSSEMAAKVPNSAILQKQQLEAEYGGIYYGMLTDLYSVANERVARLLSSYLCRYADSIHCFVNNGAALLNLPTLAKQRAFAYILIPDSDAALPFDYTKPLHLQQQNVTMQPPKLEGQINYAANLMLLNTLSPSLPQQSTALLYRLFRDTIVAETDEDAYKYRSYLEQLGICVPDILSLESAGAIFSSGLHNLHSLSSNANDLSSLLAVNSSQIQQQSEQIESEKHKLTRAIANFDQMNLLQKKQIQINAIVEKRIPLINQGVQLKNSSFTEANSAQQFAAWKQLDVKMQQLLYEAVNFDNLTNQSTTKSNQNLLAPAPAPAPAAAPTAPVLGPQHNQIELTQDLEMKSNRYNRNNHHLSRLEIDLSQDDLPALEPVLQPTITVARAKRGRENQVNRSPPDSSKRHR